MSTETGNDGDHESHPNWKDDNKIGDISDIKVGTPILYMIDDIVFEGRAEAAGWDWMVIRYYSSSGDEYIGIVTDLEEIRYNLINDPVLATL